MMRCWPSFRLAVYGTLLLAGWFAILRPAVPGAQERDDEAADYRAGKNFIPTQVYTVEEDQAILRLFRGLRVADVSDGMDKAGLPNLGLVSADIRPLWRDTRHFSHRFVGIAVTARYVPTNKPPPGEVRAVGASCGRFGQD